MSPKVPMVQVQDPDVKKLVKITEAAQKQSRRRWIISICVSAATLLVCGITLWFLLSSG